MNNNNTILIKISEDESVMNYYNLIKHFFVLDLKKRNKVPCCLNQDKLWPP